MKNGFDYKSDRHRISSADSSTPTVVEGQDIAEGKDIGKIFYSYKYFEGTIFGSLSTRTYGP